MDIYGLIGKNLTHSFSPSYFNQKFSRLSIDAQYQLFEIEEISRLRKILLNTDNLRGLNITIPYKSAVIPFLDEIDTLAKDLVAVNTIKIEWKNGRQSLKGFNTDVMGFEKSLRPFIANRNNIKALILGSGGSAKAVCFVLAKLNIDFYFVSRTANKPSFLHYNHLNEEIISSHHLIINTTPLGMFPEIGHAPNIPFEYIGHNHILFDLIYNPAKTQFLMHGEQKGAQITNGLKMLEIQAESSWKIWEG